MRMSIKIIKSEKSDIIFAYVTFTIDTDIRNNIQFIPSTMHYITPRCTKTLDNSH